MKSSKSIKATKPKIRTKAKTSPEELKMRAHRPQMAGDPIPRTKRSIGSS